MARKSEMLKEASGLGEVVGVTEELLSGMD